MKRPARTRLAVGAIGAVAAFALAGCATAAPPASDRSDAPADHAAHEGDTRVAISYDGGVLVLDGETLDEIDQVELDGFLRVNSAGDHDGHVFVTAADGFHLLDTGLASDTVEFTGEVFEAAAAGHVTPHEGRTALFDDGTGDVRVFDTDAVGTGELPEYDTITSEAAHHGVAIELSDGTTLSTIGTSDARTGVRLLDAARAPRSPATSSARACTAKAALRGRGRRCSAASDGVLLSRQTASFTKLAAARRLRPLRQRLRQRDERHRGRRLQRRPRRRGLPAVAARPDRHGCADPVGRRPARGSRIHLARRRP